MILTALITAMAAVDAYIHLQLSGLMRGGSFGGPPPGAAGGAGGRTFSGPPPGTPPLNQLPIPLDQAFLLNAMGYVVLIAAFLLAPRLLAGRAWLVNIALAVYAAVAIGAWFCVGMPNPMNQGYFSKVLEVLLIGAALLQARGVARTA